MKLLRKALIEGSFLLDLDERDMASIFRQTLDYVVARGVLPAERRDEVEAGLLDREQQVSTAIGNAVAVPHTYLKRVQRAGHCFRAIVPPDKSGCAGRCANAICFRAVRPNRGSGPALGFAGQYRAVDVR